MNILLKRVISRKTMHLALTVLSVTSVKITELNLTHADLQFVPGVGLLFGVQNSSITLSFHRQILYWLLLVWTFLWFAFTITRLLIWSFLMWWRKVEFFPFWPVSHVSQDTGSINASAEGVNINTVLNLVRDDDGRLKINNMTCDANISKMRAKFSGTLG